MVKKHLKYLEEESISIIRDTYKDAENPVVLYSIGKDSSVLLNLFLKAFYPIKVPVKFLHIDTGWKFKEMIQFRDKLFNSNLIDGLVYKNKEGMKKNINPFDHENYTDIMKTHTLREALNKEKYDFVYGGARRDEESSRSKERILSIRDKNQRWDPKIKKSNPGFFSILLNILKSHLEFSHYQTGQN